MNQYVQISIEDLLSHIWDQMMGEEMAAFVKAVVTNCGEDKLLDEIGEEEARAHFGIPAEA